jgi:fucose permease
VDSRDAFARSANIDAFLYLLSSREASLPAKRVTRGSLMTTAVALAVHIILQATTALAIVCVGVTLIGECEAAIAAFPASGFFLSVMFSIIFSLALNSIPRDHGAFSGVLCSGIIGGAVFPMIVGALGETVGLRGGMMVAFVTLFIFSIGVWAKPLVHNELIHFHVFLRRRPKVLRATG